MRGEERRGEVLKVPLLSHFKKQTKSLILLTQDDNDENNSKLNPPLEVRCPFFNG